MQLEGLAAVIADYIHQRRQQKLEPLEKELEKALKGISDEVSVATIRSDFARQIQQLDEQFNIANWLDDAAKRAKQISLVTHALKFTHGDVRGSSVLSLQYLPETDYLVTANLASPAIDAVGNAAALDVAKLLLLEHEGTSLAQALSHGDFSALSGFSKTVWQLNDWCSGLKLALADKSLSSHTLAKQLYFPVGTNQYHLLSPVFATSLAHAYSEKINATRYGEESKQIREARKNDKFHPQPDVRFLQTALQTFGGSKPQNISQLNSQRGGKMNLLPCTPPSWQSSLKPPVHHKSIFFSREFNQSCWREVQDLQRYLSSVKQQNSTVDIRRTIATRVNDVIDQLLHYAAEIQSLAAQAGWSQQNSVLNQAEKLWLDPKNPDMLFQQQRAMQNWQQQICEAFGSWLNHKLNHGLKHDGLLFAKVQQQHWSKLLAPRLREYELGTEVFQQQPTLAEVRA